MSSSSSGLTLDQPTAIANPPTTDWGEVLTQAFVSCRDELVSTLVYVLGDRDSAQDAAQESFLKCWRSRQTLPDVLNIRAWIFRVGLNTAKDLQRSAWNRRSRSFAGDEMMVSAKEHSVSQTLEEQEELQRLRHAITNLRPEEKEIFLLRQNGGLTYEEIAEIRHAPVGTVKTQMRSALQKLRKVLA